jgi:3-oxoacyl-[acyl-carrier-protein] synthase II
MHATSTPQGDLSELKAIRTLFGERSSLSISGTKSMTGHLLGAAGAIEAILTILALKEGKVTPTINTEEIEPEFASSFHIPLGKAVEKEMEYGLSNTFGFGGHIASVLMKKWK